jgi:hypothetical protein
MDTVLAIGIGAFGLIPAVLLPRRIGSTLLRLFIVAGLAVGAAWLSWALMGWPQFFLAQWVIMLAVAWIAAAAWVYKHSGVRTK